MGDSAALSKAARNRLGLVLNLDRTSFLSAEFTSLDSVMNCDFTASGLQFSITELRVAVSKTSSFTCLHFSRVR